MTDVNEIINSLDQDTQEYMSKLTQEEFNEIIEKARMDADKMTPEDIDELLEIQDFIFQTYDIDDKDELDNRDLGNLLDGTGIELE